MLFKLFTVLAVAGLAISTWILSSSSRRANQADQAERREQPGYYLKNAVLTDYDVTGSPAIRIEAQRIDQIGHSTEVALTDVRVLYDPPGGQSWVLLGNTAHVRPGGQVVDVSGNVRLQGDGPGNASTALIRTDTMSYNIPNAMASTDSDVRIDYAGHTLNARGLIANLKDRTVRLESRVNGHFHR